MAIEKEEMGAAAVSCITAGCPLPVFCLFEYTYFGDMVLLAGTEPAIVYRALCCKAIKNCFSFGHSLGWA